jgi:hypothetical protein
VSITDVEIGRALNALVTTLNDHKAQALDTGRCHEIVTGALGGEDKLAVRADGTLEHELSAVGRIERRDGRWVSERIGAPLSGAYIPR